MKIGCSSWSFRREFETRALDVSGFARLAAELALDGIELLTRDFPSVTPLFLGQLLTAVAKLPVEISAVSVSNDFAHPDASERRRQTEDVRRWTHISGDLGVGTIRTFTGNVHPGIDAEQAKAWVYERYEAALPTAERAGVTLAVENHGGLMNSAEELAGLVMHFGSPSLQLNPDPTNFLPKHADKTEPEREVIYASLEKIARFAVHSHLTVVDFNDAGCVTNVDVPRLLDTYRKACYNGYLSIEYIGEDDPAEAVGKAVAYLRGLMEGE